MANTVQHAPLQPPTFEEKLERYERNPFSLGVTGLELLFKNARQLAIVLLVITALGYLTNRLLNTVPNNNVENGKTTVMFDSLQRNFADKFHQVTAETWLLGGLLLILVVVIGLAVCFFVSGVVNYSSASLAKNKNVTLNEAMKASYSNFRDYSWLMILVGIKIFLWSLLLIVPGIIMAVRYSLAGTAFFDQGLKGNNAIRHSADMTKGAWLTTFAAVTLLPVLSFGLLRNMTTPGTNALLYRQYARLQRKGSPKPKAHWLSWLVLVVFGLIFIVALAALTLFTIAIVVVFNRGESITF